MFLNKIKTLPTDPIFSDVTGTTHTVYYFTWPNMLGTHSMNSYKIWAPNYNMSNDIMFHYKPSIF